MKIKNISNQELNIAFVLDGKATIVQLKPGYIIYSEKTSIDSKQLLIFQKKKLIESNDEDKPINGIYYHPYPTIKRTSSSTTIPMFEDVYDEPDDAEEKVPEIIAPIIASDDENIDDVDIDDGEPHTKNEAVLNPSVKNKGGRPPGAKNKPKRGRKKGTKVKNKNKGSVEQGVSKPGSDINPYDDWE